MIEIITHGGLAYVVFKDSRLLAIGYIEDLEYADDDTILEAICDKLTGDQAVAQKKLRDHSRN